MTKKYADFKYFWVEKVKLFFLIFCDKKLCGFQVFFSDFLWHFQWLFCRGVTVINRCSLRSHLTSVAMKWYFFKWTLLLYIFRWHVEHLKGTVQCVLSWCVLSGVFEDRIPSHKMLHWNGFSLVWTLFRWVFKWLWSHFGDYYLKMS